MTANVLSHLVTNENSFTNLLVALCDLKPIREVIVKTFTQGNFGADEVDFESISTQFDIGGAIPDICIQQDDLITMVEVNVYDWRELTVNQPHEYLKWLVDTNVKDKFFVFLVPPHYSPDHRQVYEQRRDDFCASKPQHGIKFVEINWLDLRSILQKTGLSSSCNYTRDFENLIEEWFLPTPITFTHSELQVTDMYNKDAANALSKLLEVVEQIATDIKRAGFSTKTNFNLRPKVDEYGIIIYCGDTPVLELGICFEFWKEYGYPLFIGVLKDHHTYAKAVPRFQNAFPSHDVYPKSGDYQWLIKEIDSKLLENDAVKNISGWLLTGYLKDICAAVNRGQCTAASSPDGMK